MVANSHEVLDQLLPPEKPEKKPGAFAAVVAGGSSVVSVLAATKAVELWLDGYPPAAVMAVGGLSGAFMLNTWSAGLQIALETETD